MWYMYVFNNLPPPTPPPSQQTTKIHTNYPDATVHLKYKLPIEVSFHNKKKKTFAKIKPRSHKLNPPPPPTIIHIHYKTINPT